MRDFEVLVSCTLATNMLRQKSNGIVHKNTAGLGIIPSHVEYLHVDKHFTYSYIMSSQLLPFTLFLEAINI